jgi:hypothetical protein
MAMATKSLPDRFRRDIGSFRTAGPGGTTVCFRVGFSIFHSERMREVEDACISLLLGGARRWFDGADLAF